MWYEVRQEFGYENWSEGVFRTVDEAIDCILEQFTPSGHGNLFTYDLVDGLPKVVGIAEISSTDVESLKEPYWASEILDSDTAYTFDDDDIILVRHGGTLNV